MNSTNLLPEPKLVTVEEHGGMLVGADFSENWGTPQSRFEITPLLVCKPKRRRQYVASEIG
jgi:hypothetical protein